MHWSYVFLVLTHQNVHTVYTLLCFCLALGQSWDCPSVSEVTLKGIIGKINQYQTTTKLAHQKKTEALWGVRMIFSLCLWCLIGYVAIDFPHIYRQFVCHTFAFCIFPGKSFIILTFNLVYTFTMKLMFFVRIALFIWSLHALQISQTSHQHHGISNYR